MRSPWVRRSELVYLLAKDVNEAAGVSVQATKDGRHKASVWWDGQAVEAKKLMEMFW